MGVCELDVWAVVTAQPLMYGETDVCPCRGSSPLPFRDGVCVCVSVCKIQFFRIKRENVRMS